MLTYIFLTAAVHAAPLDFALWRAHADDRARAEAVREYEYARERWTHDSTMRSFVLRDQIGESWGSEAGNTPRRSSDKWDDPNQYEPQIVAAADALIRLELEVGERFGLQPPQTWDSFYILNSTESRLAPRAAQAKLADLDEIVARVGEISPSLKAWLISFVTGRFEVFADRNGPAEDELDWRRRVWGESQLYDHRNASPAMLIEHAEYLGPDPTDAFVRLEEATRLRFNLSREENWEYVHHLLRSWQDHPWLNSYRPRRYGPEPDGYREAMLTGIRAIYPLAHQRLTFHLAHHEQPERKYAVDEHASPGALDLAERELERDLNLRSIDPAIVGRFVTTRLKLRGSRRPYVPVPIDPAVAEELGARLIHARVSNGCAARLDDATHYTK